MLRGPMSHRVELRRAAIAQVSPILAVTAITSPKSGGQLFLRGGHDNAGVAVALTHKNPGFDHPMRAVDSEAALVD